MRCAEEWYQAVPDLRDVQHFVSTNPRKPYVSPGNFPEGWTQICEILRAAETNAANGVKAI